MIMAKSKTKVRYRRAKAKSAIRHKKSEIHLVPDAMAVLGLGPIVAGNASGSTPYQQYKGGAGIDGVMGALQANLTSGTQLKTVAAWEIGAIVAKWIGKKVGLNKVGSGKVKLF